MRMNLVVLIGLVLVIVENSVVPWLVPSVWSERLLPHLAFVMTLFVAAFAGRHPAFLYGLGFGLLHDLLAYGHLTGPYGFGMGLIGYLAGLLAEYKTYSIGMFAGALAAFGTLLDSIVYLIYRLFSLTKLDYSYVFYWQIAPTALLQLLIGLLLYVPARRWLVRALASTGEENPE